SESIFSSSKPTGTHNPTVSMTLSINVEPDISPSTSRDDASTGAENSGTHVGNGGTSNASLQSFKDEKSAKKCFFCNKTIVKRKGRNIYCRQVKHKIPFLERYKTHATEQGRIDVLRKIQENKKCPDDKCHKIARENLINHIQRQVIENRRIISLTHVRNCFAEFVKELYGNDDLDGNIQH
ncbi:hypothetical protein PV326_010447, partial [Microctonus aethiopoides]